MPRVIAAAILNRIASPLRNVLASPWFFSIQGRAGMRVRQAIFMTALAGVIAAASVQPLCAQGGGGGGAGGSSAGGPSGGGAASGSASGSSSAGSAFAGSRGANRMSQSPGSAAGLNSSGDTPSAPSSSQGTTTGIANPPANPQQQAPPNGDLSNSPSPPQGTTTAGTANSTDVGNGVPRNVPTKTREEGSDAQIDAENRKADAKTMKGICKGC